MAVTLSIAKRGLSENQRYVDVDVTGPSSYTTGGETLSAANAAAIFGENILTADFTKCEFFQSEIAITSKRYLVIDRANNKMIYGSGNSEVSSATDLSLVTIRARFWYGGVAG